MEPTYVDNEVERIVAEVKQRLANEGSDAEHNFTLASSIVACMANEGAEALTEYSKTLCAGDADEAELAFEQYQIVQRAGQAITDYANEELAPLVKKERAKRRADQIAELTPAQRAGYEKFTKTLGIDGLLGEQAGKDA